MRIRQVLWFLLLAMVALILVLPGAEGAPTFSNQPFSTEHVLVKFKPSVRTQLPVGSAAETMARLLAAMPLPPGANLIEPELNRLMAPRLDSGVRRAGAAVAGPNWERFFYLRLPPGMAVEECLRRVSTHPWVEYVEPDGWATGGFLPNDPNFSSQWHHRNLSKPSAAIQTPAAWDITKGSTNVLIAVLDSGLTPSAEFSGRLVPGYNFAYGTTDTTDDVGHGTAVAATAAATGNNSALVAGVDWHCRILPVKILDSSNNGLYSWFAQGVDYAVSQGARIINLSAGGTSPSSTLAQSIANAIAQGVIFVTITHNDGTGAIRFPGSLPECITVGATDELDRRTSFSNYGPAIDLCAPGIDIYTVGANGALQVWWGTSFSAPQVSGVCGLLLSLRPDLTHHEARLLLCAGADDAVGDATDTPGFDDYYGWGRLNAYNTLLLARMQVDQVTRSNGRVQLSWPSPANASNKQPFQVEFKDGLAATWSTVTNSSGFAYTGSRTFWTDMNPSDTGRFYRVRLRPLP